MRWKYEPLLPKLLRILKCLQQSIKSDRESFWVPRYVWLCRSHDCDCMALTSWLQPIDWSYAREWLHFEEIFDVEFRDFRTSTEETYFQMLQIKVTCMRWTGMSKQWDVTWPSGILEQEGRGTHFTSLQLFCRSRITGSIFRRYILETVFTLLIVTACWLWVFKCQ